MTILDEILFIVIASMFAFFIERKDDSEVKMYYYIIFSLVGTILTYNLGYILFKVGHGLFTKFKAYR